MSELNLRISWLMWSEPEHLTTVFEGPGLLPPEDPVEESGVDHPSIEAKVVVEGRPDVPHGVQLLPHPRALQVVCILRDMETWRSRQRTGTSFSCWRDNCLQLDRFGDESLCGRIV